ncbi:MAG: hypothetical protein M3Q79_02475 [bacterium]|nr:hypothetical protein [bacterium]
MPRLIRSAQNYPVDLVSLTLPWWVSGNSEMFNLARNSVGDQNAPRFVGANPRADDYYDKTYTGLESLVRDCKPNSMTLHPNTDVDVGQFCRVVERCKQLGVTAIGYTDTHRYPIDLGRMKLVHSTSPMEGADEYDASSTHDDHSVLNEMLRAKDADLVLGFDGFLVDYSSVGAVVQYLKKHKRDNGPEKDMMIIAQKFNHSATDGEAIGDIKKAFDAGASGIYMAGLYMSRRNRPLFINRLVAQMQQTKEV